MHDPLEAEAETADDKPPPPDAREWTYLVTPAFQTRYILAAHYLEPCEHIVEIGGYRTPITRFLRTPKRSVTVLDPRVEPLERDELLGQGCRVRHVQTLFQDHHDWPAEYGLALLGLDFELYELPRRRRQSVLDRFAPVVLGAHRIVIEIARDWPASRWLAGWVMKQTGYDKVLQVTLDLKGDLGVDLSGSWPPFWRRTLMVLDRPGGGVQAGAPA